MLDDPEPQEDSPCRQNFLSRNDVVVVEKCMSSMQAGTQMIKLRGSSKGLVRFYYLDEHKSCIRWRPSRKNEKAKISIDSIQEVCEGKQSEIFQRYADGSFDPNCCFSIYYGDHMESLDLVSSSGEEARTWITGLKYLMAGISDEDSLSKRQRTRDQWLKQTFDEADKNGDGSLSISEVLQLMHKLNVNLPRQKVKQMFKEADTDDNQGTLDFEEFCAFYKMMSTRRDLYLLMLSYSNHKDYLDVDDLRRFLDAEQKMSNVTKDHCLEIINQFEPCPENRQQGALGIDGFTNYMRSPAGDIFNPEHYHVNQDMTQPLSHYFITSSHNTYLMGDQLMSQSRVDMYAWVLQSGCRCVEVDCWDGPDGEPIVHHGYTLTSKILFKDVIETINKYAFIRSEYPVILSIENHCSVAQQKKMAQYLTEVLGDKLDLSSVRNEDPTKLPSPESLKGKILVKGKKLPANISEDVEEGEVSDEDSADEMDDDCKLMNGDASTNRKRVENMAKKKLDSLIKESKIRDCEDPNNFTVATLPPSGKLGNKHDLKKNKHEEDVDSGQDAIINKRHNRSLMGSFSKRKKKGSKLKRASSPEDGEDDSDCQGNIARGSVHYSKTNRQKKTMKLSRALSDLVKYTKSVGSFDVESEISSSWQVSSFSETKAHQILQQKPAQYLRFNQHQLSRIYPSSYRVDSSNYNPQPFWNAGCQLVALNYQSEGRMLQLNRAKFNANGNCGYVLKPTCMCQGTFNPNSEDPLLGQMKKQLVLRIISGQQLPKPRDSMLGDRGEIIDPFVEVELIGLPVDCCKEQTRVVDDNGFNPMWEETLVFTICMPEIALIRFLVWDHDPIGRDFIGQRTISFTSMMPGYRHVYLEGMEEASIFVHVAVNDICGKAKQALGLKGLFLRNPKQASLDSHAAGQLNRKDSFSSHILRRTASAPTKTQKKAKKGFPEIAIDTKDNGSDGTGEDHGLEDSSHPRFDQEPERGSPALSLRDRAFREAHGKGLKGKAQSFGKGKSSLAHVHRDAAFSEPIRRSNRVRLQEPPAEKPGVFARCAINGSGRIGMATNCMKCMIGSNESPDLECKWSSHAATRPAAQDGPPGNQYSSLAGDEEGLELQNWGVQEQQPQPQPDLPFCSGGYGAAGLLPKTCQPSGTSKCHGAKSQSRQRWQGQPGGKYGSTVNLVTASNGSVSSDSSSLESLGSPDFPKHLSESSRKQAGTLQREMNALFAEKLEEIRSKSPIFFTDVHQLPVQKSIPSLRSLETICEEPFVANKNQLVGSCFLLSTTLPTDSKEGDVPDNSHETSSEGDDPSDLQQRGVTGAEKEISHAPSPAIANVLEWDYSRSSGKEEGSCRRIHENGDPPTSQTQGNVALANRWLHSAGNCQNQGSGTVQPLVNDERSEESPTTPVSPYQSNVANISIQIAPQGAPEATQVQPPTSHVVVKRSKSEGCRLCDCSVLMRRPDGFSPAAEVYSDATANDHIWSKLDSGTHRDSMSSSSSMSSNDTVIDLSLPSLARKSLPDLVVRHEHFEALPARRSMRPWSASAAPGRDIPMVTKSKSNPNLRGDQPTQDTLCPRPLSRGSVPKRHTWSWLYIESLKQSCLRSQGQGNADMNPAKSKSLGDLTSEDITCTFEGKYRSISRSFVTQSMREKRHCAAATFPAQPHDELTERLKKLTIFQQENDITSATSLGLVESEEDEEQETGLLRRASSRSQSRVRYIANRAKQAQERQRLQNLTMGKASPIEERGNPEGACCFAGGACTDAAASPTLFTPQCKDQTLLNRDAEVVFLFKL
ncbi:1-phosphatidylinositol 4,5-bisphosphate phosphodiesterase eta-2 isoform X2 [Anolis carolinensis]|uniref:1-phosphatidylinositol 4,5-bisphosphate phosphodiesterase eta-2 isoform X2 n=1 Tax=Anolis carolinensis TaxID=28377 RepID=UPI002F2B7678